MEIIFNIPGPPQGKARPRVVRMKNGHSMTYTPDKTVAYEELIRTRFMDAADAAGWLLSEQPLKASVTALYPIPKSASRKKHAAMLAHEILPTKKPDCDNIAKIIFDALNGFAYKDDAQIVYLTFGKRYTDGTGKVFVRLTEIGRENEKIT